MTELERCIEFIRRIEDRAAAQREDFRFGVAHLNDRLPRVWSRNYLLAEKNLDTATAGLLATEADRILGGAGLGHRKVEINDAEVGERLDPGFRDLGWNVQCDLIMVARREPDVQADLSRVEEVHVEELEPAWAEGTRSEPYGSDEEVVEQLVAANRVMMEAVATRFFAARVDGEIASYCDLYSEGRTGQIEAVMTLERYRNRGLARATVLRALAESRGAGDDLTFLMANRDDWPWKLYAKLGFDEIGCVYEFIRPSA